MKNKLIPSVSAVDSIEGQLCMKDYIHSSWKKATTEDVLSSRQAKDEPLTKKEKNKLPCFGFNKPLGTKSNKQQYPCIFIILELDTPDAQKKKIVDGCRKTEGLVRAQFDIWYSWFSHAIDIPFFWIYLTPSMRGIRFVLRLNHPVYDQDEYEQAVKQFLRMLYLKTNGAINTDHFDIRINQAWYVPTFQNYFYKKGMTFYLTPFKEKERNKNFNCCILQTKGKQTSQSDLSIENRFIRSIKITQKKFTYAKGQRNDFIHYLACNCNRFAIPKSEALNLILGHFDLDESEINQTTNSAYTHNKNDYGKFLTS